MHLLRTRTVVRSRYLNSPRAPRHLHHALRLFACQPLQVRQDDPADRMVRRPAVDGLLSLEPRDNDQGCVEAIFDSCASEVVAGRSGGGSAAPAGAARRRGRHGAACVAMHDCKMSSVAVPALRARDQRLSGRCVRPSRLCGPASSCSPLGRPRITRPAAARFGSRRRRQGSLEW